MKSFLNDIFLPKYYDLLGIRKNTMKLFFENLEKLNLDFYTIVETGTSRGGISDISGNGSATYLFDEFVNFYDGVVFSFDIDKFACEKVNRSTSKKCNVICEDSLVGINELKNKKILNIDGLYLDSYDTKFNDDVPSSTHALKEFRNALFYLNNNSIIAIDDTPSKVEELPPWVKSDPRRFGNNEYMDKLKFPCGKGRLILDFVNNNNQFKLLKHNYQIVIKKEIEDQSIPHILHRTWKTKEPDYSIFPKKAVDSWEKQNPNLLSIIHTDEDNLNFITQNYPWFLKTYESYPKEIFRADAVRYFYLLHYGGIYSDLDMECRKPIIKELPNNMHLVTNKKDWVSNAIMASAPGNSFWKNVIVNGLIPNKNNSNVLYATGPGMLSKVFYNTADESLQNKCHLPESKYYPIKYDDNFSEKYNNLSKEVVTVHHFSHSWK